MIASGNLKAQRLRGDVLKKKKMDDRGWVLLEERICMREKGLRRGQAKLKIGEASQASANCSPRFTDGGPGGLRHNINICFRI